LVIGFSSGPAGAIDLDFFAADVPDSPACGFSPATAIRGALPNRDFKNFRSSKPTPHDL